MIIYDLTPLHAPQYAMSDKPYHDARTDGRRNPRPSAQRLMRSELVETPEGCWEWQGKTTVYGYGSAYVGSKRINAHRLAWIMAYGPVPSHMAVCHRCDNRKCVRLDHLFLGTFAENNADMVRKGRAAKGERVGGAVMNRERVRKVWELHHRGLSGRRIAGEIGCSLRTVQHVINLKRWQHYSAEVCSAR